ncbi:hypothetical protein WICPIJ_001245 [Wickerhamomyces pijperi]|uniref:Uncharacterized protein n=1 Tax=Wickerhamomyces pijperi TaxID=599730 RepID=A0A9P8QB48_WICPI|nr:hypothetical protein WICPIJ_001245 [Wickerhamomyces pijperi]
MSLTKTLGVGYSTKGFNASLERIKEYITEYGSEVESVFNADYLREQYLNATFYLKDLYYNFDFAVIMGIILNCFWLGVLNIIGAGNFIKRLGYHRRFNGPVINCIRAKFTVPALFSGKHTMEHVFLRFYVMLLPTRIEYVVMVLFDALNGLLLRVNLNAHHPYELYEVSFSTILNIYMDEAVANHLQECPNRVDLFEEPQVW